MYLSKVMEATADKVPVGAPEILNLFAFDRAATNYLAVFTEEVMRGKDRPLTFYERELIAALVSKQNGCMFCMTSHAATAGELLPGGLEHVRLVLEHHTLVPPTISERELALSLLVHASKAKLDVEIREKMVRHALQKLTSEEAYQVNLIIALFNFYNHWVLSNGVAEMSPEGYAESGKRLATQGYVGL